MRKTRLYGITGKTIVSMLYLKILWEDLQKVSRDVAIMYSEDGIH